MCLGAWSSRPLKRGLWGSACTRCLDILFLGDFPRPLSVDNSVLASRVMKERESQRGCSADKKVHLGNRAPPSVLDWLPWAICCVFPGPLALGSMCDALKKESGLHYCLAKIPSLIIPHFQTLLFSV